MRLDRASGKCGRREMPGPPAGWHSGENRPVGPASGKDGHPDGPRKPTGPVGLHPPPATCSQDSCLATGVPYFPICLWPLKIGLPTGLSTRWADSPPCHRQVAEPGQGGLPGLGLRAGSGGVQGCGCQERWIGWSDVAPTTALGTACDQRPAASRLGEEPPLPTASLSS